MSDISFSHQFSQRWRNAPAPIKQAIVEELNDIIQLLDKDTELKTFDFQYSNLDKYLDDSYFKNHSKDADLKGSSTVSLDTQDGNQTAESHDRTDNEDFNQTLATTVLTDEKLEGEPSDSERVVKELEAYIEDYLSEQLTGLSEELKTWLRTELEHRIHKS